MSQISSALGLRSGGGRLHVWLQGVPPPEWTRRPNSKDDLREQAVALRRSGLSYREIGQTLPVSKSTLSLWLRDVPLTDEHRVAMKRRSADLNLWIAGWFEGLAEGAMTPTSGDTVRCPPSGVV